MSDDFTPGWFYIIDNFLGSTYFYIGGFSGYRSLLQYYPANHLTIIVLSNTSTTPIWNIKQLIRDILTGQKVNYPRKSFVRYLSEEIRGNANNVKAPTGKFSCDTSKYILRPTG